MTILEQAKELRQQASDHMNLEGLDRIKVKKLEHHTLLTLCDALIEAWGVIEFYGNCDNWEVSAIDDLCTVKTKLTKDKESFGEVSQPGAASKLVLYGGFRARDFLTKHGGTNG